MDAKRLSIPSRGLVLLVEMHQNVHVQIEVVLLGCEVGGSEICARGRFPQELDAPENLLEALAGSGIVRQIVERSGTPKKRGGLIRRITDFLEEGRSLFMGLESAPGISNGVVIPPHIEQRNGLVVEAPQLPENLQCPLIARPRALRISLTEEHSAQTVERDGFALKISDGLLDRERLLQVLPRLIQTLHPLENVGDATQDIRPAVRRTQRVL